VGGLVGQLVFADRFSCPLSLLFRTFNLVGQDHNGFWFMAERRQPELAVKPDVVGCCLGVFLPEPMTFVTRLISQDRPLSVSRQREAN
jgi:hypothetical protein